MAIQWQAVPHSEFWGLQRATELLARSTNKTQVAGQ